MYRNLFAVFATLSMGVGAASAATAPQDPQGKSLEQRVMAAQKTLGAVMNPSQEGSTVTADPDKVAQYYWSNYSFRNYPPPWHNYSFRNYPSWNNY